MCFWCVNDDKARQWWKERNERKKYKNLQSIHVRMGVCVCFIMMLLMLLVMIKRTNLKGFQVLLISTICWSHFEGGKLRVFSAGKNEESNDKHFTLLSVCLNLAHVIILQKESYWKKVQVSAYFYIRMEFRLKHVYVTRTNQTWKKLLFCLSVRIGKVVL